MPSLDVGEVAVARGQARQAAVVEREPRGRIDRIDAVLLVDRLAQHDAPAAVAPLEEVVEAAGADHVAEHAVDLPRCEIVIFVCATARSPATSIELPPRKCRIAHAPGPAFLA